jgi:hypothetical protein
VDAGDVQTALGAQRLGALVDAYSRRVYPAVLEQHTGASVSSPLGVWVLLAACASGARGANRSALEEVLGCLADEASELLNEFAGSLPAALKAAIAVWVSVADARAELAEWVRGLPPLVESGFMPTQQEADDWADRNTLGLIKRFPAEIDADTKVVLASALATRVSWEVEFDVVPAAEHLSESSPWRKTVERLLWDPDPDGIAMIAQTRAAGVVAIHQAVAKEGLTVVSVSADPAIARDRVLDATHEVAARVRAGRPIEAHSLFDLPVGDGHSWQIKEKQIYTWRAGERAERIAGASLPAWHVRSDLNLESSALFGAAPALATLGQLIHDADEATQAAQAAVASFTRSGFEAAAVTGLVTAAGAPRGRGTERTAILRFDHPYAALAIAGKPVEPGVSGQPAGRTSPSAGLPLFAAWVHEPTEVDEEPSPG